MKDEVEYQNQVLGWYQYQGNDYYFFDETYFANKYATSAREEFLFQKGSRDVYMDFLRNTIFPSVELSLALSIGYSAVVVPRLKFLNDLGTLIVNVSGISSTGKSTAEMLMCSPFMYPDINDGTKGLNLSANTTLNAIMSTIEGVFGVPFVVDDIKTNPDINLFQYIYNIAACNQKSRCNSEGKKRKAIPAIISKSLFDKVQAILDGRTVCRPQLNKHPEYILTGFLYCKSCGSTMSGESNIGGRNKTRTRTYVCPKRKSKARKGL